MPHTDQQHEIDQNLAFFLGEMPKLMHDHAGKFALLHQQRIIGFYDTISDAVGAGNGMFPEGLFSIQHVTNESTDLGYYSYAMHMGNA
jgi:hypothetical protein